MKKFFLIILCCIVLLVFVACGGERGGAELGEDFEYPHPSSGVAPSLSEGENPTESVIPPPSSPSEEGGAPSLPTPSVSLPTPSVAPTVRPSVSPTPKPTVTPSAPAEKEKISYVRSKTDGLRVRSKAKTSSSILGRLNSGDMVVFLGKENGFYKTWYKEKVGYVAASYCDFYAIEKTSEQVERALDFGYKLLGYPYVWGSVRYHDGDGVKNASFKGTEFDCSALVQYIYYAACKIKLGTTTREQVKNGTAVKRSNLRRGDLLFFTNADRAHLSGNERIGHVALYLGDNYILHTASDYAVIEPISKARWKNYITARRVV
ncbi:MAG: C40 family peptidase [Clostridia bacterium]|nr:C40 family peptidase [Clostridia bacterium]